MFKSIMRAAGSLMLFFAVAGGVWLGVSAAYAQSLAETSMSAGFGGGNEQCGGFEPNGSIAYDRDSDDLAAHMYLKVGPNGSCSGQGFSIDSAVTKIFPYRGPWGGFVTGAYDRRTIPFEFGVKNFRGYDVDAISAIVGLRYDCGDECSIRLGYNAVETAKANGGNTSPVFLAANYELFDEWEISGDTNFTVTNFRIGRTGSILDVSAGVTFGAHNLAHPAPSMVPALDDDGDAIPGHYWTRRDPPSPLYSIHIGMNL